MKIKLALQTPETRKLVGRAKILIAKTKNRKNVSTHP